MLYDQDKFLFKLYEESFDSSLFLGSVLFLGMGSAILPRLYGHLCDKVSIIEIDKNIYERYKHYLQPEWNIILDDVYKWNSQEKFDVIVSDLWARYADKEELEEVRKLYEPKLKPNGKFIWLKKVIRK